MNNTFLSKKRLRNDLQSINMNEVNETQNNDGGVEELLKMKIEQGISEEQQVDPEEQQVDPEEQHDDPEEQQVDPEEQHDDPEEQHDDPEEQQDDPEEQHDDPEEQHDDPELQQDDPEEQQDDPEEQHDDPDLKDSNIDIKYFHIIKYTKGELESVNIVINADRYPLHKIENTYIWESVQEINISALSGCVSLALELVLRVPDKESLDRKFFKLEDNLIPTMSEMLVGRNELSIFITDMKLRCSFSSKTDLPCNVELNDESKIKAVFLVLSKLFHFYLKSFDFKEDSFKSDWSELLYRDPMNTNNQNMLVNLTNMNNTEFANYMASLQRQEILQLLICCSQNVKATHSNYLTGYKRKLDEFDILDNIMLFTASLGRFIDNLVLKSQAKSDGPIEASLDFLQTATVLVKDTLKLYDEVLNYKLQVSIYLNCNDRRINPVYEKQLIVEFNLYIRMAGQWFCDPDYFDRSYDILNGNYEIVHIEDITADDTKCYLKDAILTIKNIFENIDQNSLLFNIFAFMNNTIIFDKEGKETKFIFSKENTFHKTKLELVKLIPEYLILYNYPRVKSFLYAFTNPSKLICFNTNGMTRRHIKNTVRSVLVLLHELIHIKRSVLTKFSFVDSTPANLIDTQKKAGESGQLFEHLLIDEGAYDFLINDMEVLGKKDYEDVLKVDHWLSDMSFINTLAKKVMLSEEKSERGCFEKLTMIHDEEVEIDLRLLKVLKDKYSLRDYACRYLLCLAKFVGLDLNNVDRYTDEEKERLKVILLSQNLYSDYSYKEVLGPGDVQKAFFDILK
jgi:hypothetical protein